MFRFFMLGLCVTAFGCGSKSDVDRVLELTIERPWHQWAQIADMSADNLADVITVSHVLDSGRTYFNVFVRQVDGSYALQRIRLSATEWDRVSHVLVEDLDLDGMPDAVVTYVGITAAGGTPGETIKVLVKSGSGAIQFDPAVTYTVGENPLYTAAGDVDGDGLPDLAVAGFGGVDLLIQNSGSPGQFRSARQVSAAQTEAVAIADMNRDGFADLLSAGDGGVQVYLNDPNEPGAFRTSTEWPVSSWPCGIAVGDFNGDGWLDFATCHSAGAGDSYVAQRLQDPLAPGSFSAVSELQHGEALTLASPASADLNRDGRDDLMFAVRNGLDGVSIGVHLADAGGNFGAASYFRDNATTTGPWSASLGELDGDGLLDVVLARSLDGAYAHEGNGDGTFGTARKIGD